MTGRGLWRVLAFGVVLLVAPAALAADPNDAYESVLDQDFVRPRPKTDVMRQRLQPLLETHRMELLRRQRSGEDLDCARQILIEAQWLLNYTNRAPDLEARLADLKAQLENPDSELPNTRDPDDDGYGRCLKEWFLRVDDSFHRLDDALSHGMPRLSSMKLMAPINSPELLTAYLKKLMVSNVERDGVDRRKELNVMVTAMAQFLFLPKFQPYVQLAYADGRLHPGLADALRRFMDKRWQDPRTGYWGAAYRIQGKVMRTADLSITFHIVSYRDGQVRLWDRIVATTFDIREQPYPFGWEDMGRQNTHHNYDVVRLLRLGWSSMTPGQRDRATAEIAIMQSRVLRLSLRGDGSFDDRPFDSVGQAYYFGVSFLDETGFFRPSRRFWTDFALTDGEPVRRRIENRIRTLDLDDAMMRAALRKISARD